MGTLLTASVLFGLAFAEDLISSWRVTTRFKIKIDPKIEAAESIRELVDEIGLRTRSWMITKVEHGLTLRISVVGPTDRIEKLQAALMADERVESFRRV